MAATNPTPARSARLTPDGRAVEITQMSLTDPTVVHAAQTWAQRHRDQAAAPGVGQLDLTPFVEESMRLAAVVWQAGGDSRDVIGIQQTLGHVTERTEKAVAEASERSTQANKHAQEQLDRVRDETAKALSLATTTSTRQMAVTADKVGEDIAKLFGGDDNPLVASARAAIGRAMTDVQTSFEQRMQQVVADVDSKWDPRVPTSPVAQMTAWFKVEQDKLLAVHHDTGREVTAKLDQIATQLVALSTTKTVTARTASVTPLKGAPFEDQVHTAIEGIAAGLGDGYLRAGTTVGAVKNSKRGDGVLVVHDVPGASEGTANVVIEASNRDTPRDWSTYLDDAMRNRQAPVALGIARTAEQVPGGGPIRMWGVKKVVVAYDPETDDPALLHAIVLLLRTQACVSVSRSGVEQVRTAEEALAAAATQLDQFAELRRLVGSIQTNADKTVVKMAGLQEFLTRQVTVALSALREASGPPASAAA